MRATVHADVTQFARLVRPLFATDPVQHNAALTVLGQVEFADEAGALASVADKGSLRGAVLGNPGWPVAVSGLPERAASLVADVLVMSGISLPGATGPRCEAEAFATAWTRSTGVEAKPEMVQVLHALGTLVPPCGVPGEFRLCDPRDFSTVVAWRSEFVAEAVPLASAEENPAGSVVKGIALGGAYGVWAVGQKPVSMAFARAADCGMSRISFVYTPPEHRGHGYASAVTAAVSSWAQGEAAHVVLFTDADNPVANAVYRRLGYRPVHEAIEFAFGGR
jgi:GNAT superfamily N-acetyltransferase